MPRTKRLLYNEAVYHILQRGHNKAKLFKADRDCDIFISIIRDYKKRYYFDIYHYCIMPNHFHVLLKIKNGEELPKIMQGIEQSYSYYYRKKYTHSGYVYQNRYKTFHVQDNSYLMECGRYIERNPLRAGIVEDLSKYLWSSFNFYVNGRKNEIITEDPLCATLGKTDRARQAAYKNYVLTPRPYENLIDKAMFR